MINFRKLAVGASGTGQIMRRYFTENTPEPAQNPAQAIDRQLDPSGRLTAYYTSRDSRAHWRSDMPHDIAKVLGISPRSMPRDAELDMLFEGRRADTGEAWSKHTRTISAYDFTTAPHKSVTLAAEFAPTASEGAAIQHAMDKANDATMRYIAREIGWARKGAGGEDGAEPGSVGWVSFRHHVARPTLPIRDGRTGATYLADVPVDGDPHGHTHNAMFNVVVTETGRVGSLDTRQMHSRVHEFGAYYQARLAEHLRKLGIEVGYNADEQAVVVLAIPKAANDLFSKSTRQVMRSARAFAKEQGLDWDDLSAERKIDILSEAGVASRLAKHGHKTDREIWVAQAQAIGWVHESVIGKARHEPLSDGERFDSAYRFAARHLAQEFRTAAVIDHSKLRTYAARGLIGTGIAGGVDDIDRVVERIESRGIKLRGEQVALVIGLSGDTVQVTNTAQIRIEQRFTDLAKAAAGNRAGALSDAAITAAINASGLNRLGQSEQTKEHWEAQRAAIYALGQAGSLSLLTGVAGSGKSTLLQPLVRAWMDDRRFDAGGRDVIGAANSWRQANALADAGITNTMAIQPLLSAIAKGEIAPTRNTVLVIDEVGQVSPRQMLTLLELQAKTGMTIRAIGDREQAQSIEAGDTIELMRRALPSSAQPELLSTVRQRSKRDKTIARLFREGQASEALELKREDGTAILAGGDQDQVVARIADLYMERRDHLRAAGDRRGITVSALTNDDASDISREIRRRLRERGEIERAERTFEVIDQRGQTSRIGIAIGDSLRLYRRTLGEAGGKTEVVGNNGDIVRVVAMGQGTITLKNSDGTVAEVQWRRLADPESNRLMVGYGHVLTIDSAQGITSTEHINALPRGSAGITKFKGYVAESRATHATWTVISEAATLEAEKRSRALGDPKPITEADLWKRVAADFAAKPYKALATDLLQAHRRDREALIDSFIAGRQPVEAAEAAGHDVGQSLRLRLQAEAVSHELRRQIPAFTAAIEANIAGLKEVGREMDHLRQMRAEAEQARSRIDEAASPRPSRSPSPGE